jgi:5'-methylthioinosine phosphorylase
MSAYAVIGGTGLAQLDGLEIVQQHDVQTPYGEPSGPIDEGRLLGHTVFFLHRHGASKSIPPHLINYRANLWALQSLGVENVIAINAVGGISLAMHPGRLLIPDQLIDYSWGREHTFDTGDAGLLMHIEFTEPYDRALRMSLLAAAQSARISCEDSGVHGITQGPRLETAAEIVRMARDGCDVVGMTGMPEAALARELNMPYACICMVVNAAAGLGDVPLTLEMMGDILSREAGVVRELILKLLAGEG